MGDELTLLATRFIPTEVAGWLVDGKLGHHGTRVQELTQEELLEWGKRILSEPRKWIVFNGDDLETGGKWEWCFKRTGFFTQPTYLLSRGFQMDMLAAALRHARVHR